MKIEEHSIRDIPRRRFLELGMKGGLLIAASPALLSQLVSCSTSNSASPGLNMDNGTLNKVIARALARGGDFADIYLENRISRQITMEESKFKGGLYGISQGAGVRVISGNKTGYAYTDEITEAKLLRAAEVASYVAQNSAPVSPVNITRASRPSFVSVKLPLNEISDEKRIDVIKRADQAAKDFDPRIKMALIEYNDEIRSRVIANRPGEYAKLDREWTPGDQVTLTLDLRGRAVPAPSGAPQLAVMRGPILLALDNRLVPASDTAVWLSANAEHRVELQPCAAKPAWAWLAFTAPFQIRPSHFFNHSVTNLALCDFASAGNTWSETNLYRTWLPQPLFLRQAFVTNTWKLLEPGPLRPVMPAQALAPKAVGQPVGQEQAPGESP